MVVYKVLLQYYRILLRTTKYNSVLQSTSTTPILLCTTKYYSSTTPYYRALLRPLKRCQNDVLPILLRTTPVLQKLPKRAFRARLPQLFKEQASKTSISCDASSNFHRTRFQNERFARCFRQFSQKKLPKGSFPARLPPNFTEEASKTSVSCEASFKIHRTMLPKRAFRTMLPTILQEKASKMIVSCEASSKFHRTSFQNERFARCFRQFSRKICVSLQFRAIDTPLPARGFKSKMCFALQRRAFPNVTMCVSPQRRAQKCMNLPTVNRPASRTQKCEVLLQFWAIDTTFLPRGLTESK